MYKLFSLAGLMGLFFNPIFSQEHTGSEAADYMDEIAHQDLQPTIPANYRIAFVSYRGGTADVFMMCPDGSDLKKITDTKDNNSFPQRAEDGQHLIYRQSDPEDPYSFVNKRINLLTGAEEIHAPAPLVPGATWEEISPDGRYVAYLKEISDFQELFLFDRETNSHRQITQNQLDEIPAHSINHRWSFDGSQLAFMSGPDWYNQFLRIYYLDSGETEVVSPRGYMNSGLHWCPDNESLVLNIAIRHERSYELWRINSDGSDLHPLTDHPDLGNVHPDISPDGNWVVFESGRDEVGMDLYIMRPDGSQQIRLTDHPAYDGRPAWIVLD